MRPPRTEAIGDSTIPAPLRWLLAPLRWLERARGRWRLALALLYLLVLAVAGFFAWRATTLNGLPDVGDPFDVEAFEAPIPTDENAFTYYRQASKAFRPIATGVEVSAANATDWGQAPQEVRRWIGDNREALDLWRRGTERKGAFLGVIEPDEDHFNEDAWTLDRLRTFAQMAVLEGSRRLGEGDLDGAWSMYRALLRSSRQVGMRGDLYRHFVASKLLGLAAARIDAWSEDPRVGPELLRRATDEVRACEAMTPPTSEMLKAQYLAIMRQIDHPDRSLRGSLVDGSIWYHNLLDGPAIDLFLKREPERSRRVARLIFANWLAYCDRPSGSAPTIALPSSRLTLYRAGDDAPASARAIGPGALDRWFESTMLLRGVLSDRIFLLRGPAADRRRLVSLKVALAEQWYAREHGELPKSPDDLVGRYLEALPEGFRDETETKGDR